jgi:DNA-binding CsgD family transcriptional regulator
MLQVRQGCAAGTAVKIRLKADPRFYHVWRIAERRSRALTCLRQPWVNDSPARMQESAMFKARLFMLIGVCGLVIIGLTVLDLARDPEATSWAEIVPDLVEKMILLGGMAAIAWTVAGMQDLREAQEAMSNNLARTEAQGEAWRAQRQGEIAALGQAIEDQFRLWKLTTAEIDIAGLMLKGASLKEIALARETSEATIRQQAQAVYRKSGLSGRAELSAYFLDSLFAEADAQRETRLRVVPKDA